jgi:hypothetical protein
VVSALSKAHNQKIHVLLPSCFKPFKDALSLLELQPIIGGVTLIDHRVLNFSCGGQPFQVDSKKYIDSDIHYSFGLSSEVSLTEYLPYVYAKQYGLEVDDTFKLNLGTVPSNGFKCCTEQLRAKFPDHVSIDLTKDILENARVFAGATERHCWYSGFAILMELAGLDFTLHGKNPHLAYRYFKYH